MKSKNKTFDIQRLQKKGQAKITGKMTALIGGVVIIFLAVALLPDLYAEIETLNAVDTPVPKWLYTVMGVVVAGGFVFIIWKSFNK